MNHVFKWGLRGQFETFLQLIFAGFVFSSLFLDAASNFGNLHGFYKEKLISEFIDLHLDFLNLKNSGKCHFLTDSKRTY